MWDLLKNAVGKFAEAGSEYLQNRNFIQQLFAMPHDSAMLALQTRVQSLDDRGYQSFVGAIVLMIQEAQASGQILQYQGSSYNSWGDSYEDQLYSTVAHFGEGPQAPSQEQMLGMQQLQVYINSLQTIAAYADQFRSMQRPSEVTPPAASNSTPPAMDTVNIQTTQPPGSAEIKQRLAELMGQGAEMSTMTPLLEQLYQAEIREGTIATDRRLQLDEMMGQFKELAEDKSDQTEDLVTQAARARELGARLTPLAADPSLPEAGKRGSVSSRVSRTREMLMGLKTQLMNEKTQVSLAPQEEKVWEQLIGGILNIQKALETAKSDQEAYALERAALRPLAFKMQDFFLRRHMLLAIPYFPAPPVTPDPNAVFFSGGNDLRQMVAELCQRQQLSLQTETASQDPAQQRWNQLRACAVGIFDLRGYDRKFTYRDFPAEASQIAAVMYELGIAFAIGKPVVVVARQNRDLPFDVDITPVYLTGGINDLELLERGLESAIYRRQRGGEIGSIAKTIACVKRQYWSRVNPQVRTMVAMLDAQAEKDAIQTRHITSQILRFVGEKAPMMIFPAWPGDYPDSREKICFHVTAFEASDRTWPLMTRKFVKDACPETLTYKRGDDSQERDIIRAIWHDICRAWCVVVDLTDLNPNAVLELGMAHVLGRKTLVITQDMNMNKYPATIAKERKIPYSLNTREGAEKFRRDLDRYFAWVTS